MPIVFPLSPSVLDTYSYGGRTWIWNGVSWDSQGTIQGTVGPAGPQGTQGFQGSQGFQGLQGNLGPQGIQGFQGPNAAISFGPTPPVSPLIGDRWVDSNSGIEYTWINDGTNQVWVEVSASGFSGVQGLQGIQGPSAQMQGAQGVQGAQGFGTDGAQGLQGFIGTQGTSGSDGIQGFTGTQGATGFGIQGAIGSGAQGTQGLQGPNAAITFDIVPPVSPLIGDRWVDSNSGIEFTFVDDGTNQTWVEVSASGFSGVQGLQGAQGIPGLGYSNTTSTTSVTVAQGAKTFTVNNLGAFVLGQPVRVIYTVTPITYMDGYISAIVGLNVTVNVSTASGSGTFASWQFTTSGNRGVQGLQGGGFNQLQGAQGLQGLAGSAQGIQGPQGSNALITFDVVPPVSPSVGDRWIDSNSGIEYTYVNDGTNQTWVETSASGFSGIQGLQGVQGLQGSDATMQGAQGTSGAQGIGGTSGTQGLTGFQGTQGFQGLNAGISFGVTPPVSPALGDRWVDSNTGIEYTFINDGTNQTWVETSASGFSGVQGLQGPTGAGLQGVQGIQGAGTYTISPTPPLSPSVGDTWLNEDDGTVSVWNGLEWFESNTNLSGLQGIQGAQGPNGIQGLNGAFVAQGLQGQIGIQGTQGVQGINGIIGIQGNTGTQGLIGTFSLNQSITTLFETGNYLASSTSGTLTINTNTSSVWYYTVASTSSFIINITSTPNLNTNLSVGQSVSVVVLNTTGAATTSYPTSIQVDGATSGVTTRWQNAVTPVSGNASSIDAYNIVVLKTAASTYTVLASQTKFA